MALFSDGDGSLSRGEVARQYSWSPYGQLLRADIYDTSAPMSRLGHQGLLHDRLDADILAEPMVAFSRQAVQNDNRTLLPCLGRFAQRDPNATGSSILTSLVYHGESMGLAALEANGDALYGDGMSLYQYVGSNPIVRVDPLGLVGLVSGLLSGLDIGLGAMGAMDEAYQGVVIGYSAEDMLLDYGYDQMLDIEWALDWSAPDYEYSKAGGIASGMVSGAVLARAKAYQWHHIATNKGTYGPRFKRLFDEAGLSLNDKKNKVWVQHGGRHPREYHQFVYDDLKAAADAEQTKEGKARAIKKRLDKLNRHISADPSFMYDTVKGKPTPWRGRRKGLKLK